MAPVELLLARRCLFDRSNRALVSAIALISVAGVAVGVAALIVVMGVIEGIDRDIFGKLLRLQPHMKISRADGTPLAEFQTILERVTALPEVSRAEPVVARQVMFENDSDGRSRRIPGMLIGAVEYGSETIYAIPSARDGSTIALGPRELLLGAPLHYQLGSPSDRLLVVTGVLGRGGGSFRPRMRNLDVTGRYQSGIWDFDMVTGLVSLETARDVFGLGDAVDFVQLRLRDPVRRASSLRDSLAASLGAEYRISTWQDENREFFQALRLEKIGLGLVLLLVMIVASFGIAGTLILMVMEKKRQIGALKAMGASEGAIRRVFLLTGGAIGVTGAGAGLAGGLFVAHAVKHWIRIADLPPSAYNFDRLPVAVEPATVALVVAGSIAISLLSALFPASQAARLDPIDALRHD